MEIIKCTFRSAPLQSSERALVRQCRGTKEIDLGGLKFVTVLHREEEDNKTN